MSVNKPVPSSRTESLLRAYGQFLRSPILSAAPASLPMWAILTRILRLYSLHFFCVLGIGALISGLISQQDSLLPVVFTQFDAGFLFVTAVIAAPLLEESIFRLPLRGKISDWVLSGSVVILVGAAWVSGLNRSVMIGIGTALTGLNLYVWFSVGRRLVLPRIYQAYPRVIFYGLTGIFGAIHITNYGVQVWPLLPILVLPQVIVGLWLGFIRLHYGFGWAVLAHSFHNACLLLPILLMKELGSGKLQSQGLDTTQFEQLPASDQLLIGSISLYFLGGLFILGCLAWGVIQEALRKPKTPG